jgi:hypothetical protein
MTTKQPDALINSLYLDIKSEQESQVAKPMPRAKPSPARRAYLKAKAIHQADIKDLKHDIFIHRLLIVQAYINYIVNKKGSKK